MALVVLPLQEQNNIKSDFENLKIIELEWRERKWHLVHIHLVLVVA